MYRGLELLVKGAYSDALRALRRAGELGAASSVTIRASIGYACAKLGETAEARELLTALIDQYRSTYASAIWIALVYLGLGDRPTAVEWLERARHDRDGCSAPSAGRGSSMRSGRRRSFGVL
jgi:tetratricopeptide (TPR) repeat protein